MPFVGFDLDQISRGEKKMVVTFGPLYIYIHIYIKIPTQRKVQARNGFIQTRLEPKERKPAIFD